VASQHTESTGANGRSGGGPRGGLWRRPIFGWSLAGALLLTLGVVLAITLGGSPHASAGARASATVTTGSRASSPVRTRDRTPAAGGGTLGGGAGHGGGAKRSRAPVAGGGPAAHEVAASGVTEVRDPEEAKSFPVSPSVHHALASKPATAAEEVVAPGAPSNSEVRAELKQMHAVESAAHKRETATMSIVPGGDSIGGNGQLPIPQGIPEVVQRVIAGANAITDFPYVYGGGHASFVSNSYDCSGSISYALAAAGLLSVPETSGQLESWGAPGPGKWITVYANAGHVYMYVNIGGRWMRYDTVGRSGTYASRWQPEMRSNAGFVARHWPGL
jgi:cell wall-associated NlpC family hydrolase